MKAPNPGTKRPRRRGPHKVLRHRREATPAPRADRELAVATIRSRFGVHANNLLLLARSAAAAALRMDRLLRLVDWAFAFREAVADLPWPPDIESDRMRIKSPGPQEGVDVGQLSALARQVQAIVQAQAKLADCLVMFRSNHDETEPLRDFDIMMGAVALSFAQERRLRLGPRDLADIAVAIGIEISSDDPRSDWSRWQKRMPRLLKASRRVHPSTSAPHEFNDAEFFGPL